MLQQIDGQTRSDTVIADRSNTKKTYVNWIAVAEAATRAAQKSAPELPQLDQLELALKYRTQSLKEEAPAEFDPLMALFRNLLQGYSPQESLMILLTRKSAVYALNIRLLPANFWNPPMKS